MNQRKTLVAIALFASLLPGAAFSQVTRFGLSSTDGLRLHDVTAQAAIFKGHAAVRLAVAPEISRLPEYAAGKIEPEAFAWIDGLYFSNGVIEAGVAGTPAAGVLA